MASTNHSQHKMMWWSLNRPIINYSELQRSSGSTVHPKRGQTRLDRTKDHTQQKVSRDRYFRIYGGFAVISTCECEGPVDELVKAHNEGVQSMINRHSPSLVKIQLRWDSKVLRTLISLDVIRKLRWKKRKTWGQTCLKMHSKIHWWRTVSIPQILRNADKIKRNRT